MVLLWLALAVPLAGGGEKFVVDGKESSLTLHTGKAGLMKFAGHEHVIRAGSVRGDVFADASQMERSEVHFVVDAKSLVVEADGEAPEDVPKVQARMVGPELLDVEHFPEILYSSTVVVGRQTAPGTYTLDVRGELTLHGVTRPMALALRVEITDTTLKASGQAVVKQSDFGLTPVSVAGVVKVKDEVQVAFTIVAHQEKSP